MKISILTLLIFAVVVMFNDELCAQNTPLAHENSSIELTFASLSKCLDIQKKECVATFISSHGASLGVDSPKLTPKVLENELSSDASLQCLFWGSSCKSPESSRCSLSSVAKGTPLFARTYTYHGVLQKEVTVQGGPDGCPQKTSFIFQLENNDWKLVAIPHT